MKKGNEAKVVASDSSKRCRAELSRDKKIRTALKTTKIAGLVTVPS